MGNAFGIGLSIVCALMVGALVTCEALGSARGRAFTKPAASAMFVGVAIALGAWRTPYGVWIAIGLVLGAGGDVALLSSAKRWFLVGLSLFLAGHIAYVVAFATMATPKTWLTPMAVVPMVALSAALWWLWRYLGSYRPAVIAYIVTITVMLIAALAVMISGELSRGRGALILTGAVLFAVSDLAVARDKFIASGFENRAWGLPTYYAGQLLIAWSTGL